MKAIKVIDNSPILVSTVLVMCCLGYLAWYWFWICFVLTELSAYIWFRKSENES